MGISKNLKFLSVILMLLSMASCQEQIDAGIKEANQKINNPEPTDDYSDPNNHSYEVINNDIVPVTNTVGGSSSYGHFAVSRYQSYYMAPVAMNRSCNVFTNVCGEFSISTVDGDEVIKVDLGTPNRFIAPKMASNSNGDIAILWVESNEKLYLYLKINNQVIYQSKSLDEYINSSGSVKFFDIAMNDNRQVVIYYNSTVSSWWDQSHIKHYVIGYDHESGGWRIPGSSDDLLKSDNFNYLNDMSSQVRDHGYNLQDSVHLKLNQNGDERLLFHTYGGNQDNSMQNYYLLYRNNLFASNSYNYNLTSNLRNNGYSANYLTKIDSDMALDEDGNTIVAFNYVSQNDFWRTSPSTIYVSTDIDGEVSLPVNFNSSISYNVVGSFASNAGASAYVVHAYAPKVALHDGKGQIVWLSTKESGEYASQSPAKDLESIYVSDYTIDAGFTSEILIAKDIVYNVKGLLSRWSGQPSELWISQAPMTTAIGTNGKKVIVWASQDNSGYTQLYRSVKSSTAAKWGAPEKLTSTRTNKSEVKLTTSDDGGFHIYWLDEFGNQAKLKNFSFK
jgi:hypothetical protein